MNTVVTGAAFGAALTSAGIYSPQAILKQLKFQDWDMITAFLTAIASTAAIIHIGQSLGAVHLQPRGAAPIGLLGRYDGNVVGGALLGAGMALAAACPGTFLAQIGVGNPSGWYVLAGGAAAGLVFTGLVRPALARVRRREQERQQQRQKQQDKGSGVHRTALYESLGVSRITGFLAFEALCVATVAVALRLSPTTSSPAWVPRPVAGGVLIGLCQLLSVASRGTLIGVSTAFEQLGDWLWWALGGGGGGGGSDTGRDTDSDKASAKPESSSILFALAFVAGVRAITILEPALIDTATLGIPPARSLAGGFLMVLGSRVADGCTSGHGISGMSLLSTSSVITIGTAFAVGSLTAIFL